VKGARIERDNHPLAGQEPDVCQKASHVLECPSLPRTE
jgi:hypothetical protein